MKLPEGFKIIGLIVADVESIDGEIFWDNYALKNLTDLERKDILKDVSALATLAYEKSIAGEE